MYLIFVRLLLLVSGVIAFSVGAAVTFAPDWLFASSGVALGDNPSLLSEIRAPGGLLLISAIAIILSAFRTNLTVYGLALSALIYLSYGAARLWSIVVDGLPAPVLMQATAIELVTGFACLATLNFTHMRMPSAVRHGATVQQKASGERT